MKKNFLCIQALLILMLSLILKYQPPDFKDTNWDIIVFLTPYGIINNFLDKNRTVMWSFYSDISSGQIQLNNLQIILAVAIYLLMVYSTFSYFKREKLIK
jgi:hypothetical protein